MNFNGELTTIKVAINQSISEIIQDMLTEASSYNKALVEPIEAFTHILNRGGKRIRGVLCVLGYEMVRGDNHELSILAARIIELLHTYLLIIDDIADQSQKRRGGDTAHIFLEKQHGLEALHGESKTYGESMATNAALVACHRAMLELTTLPISHDLLIKSFALLNRSMITTGYGQILDLHNAASKTENPDDIEQVLTLKTAHYTFLYPLSFGMMLGGAGQKETDAIEAFCLCAGRLFQISDDLLGVFGDEAQLGKSPLDDIKEGKQTVLTQYALKHASADEASYLRTQLGNQSFSMKDLVKCRQIFESCGARAHAETIAKEQAKEAIGELKKASKRNNWDMACVDHIEEIIKQLLERKS